MKLRRSRKIRNDAKKVFYKKGTCSRTFFYLLNREYSHPLDDEEKAADPLAGGILQQGFQCGMLWGASMGVGAEAYRRFDDRDKATALAIKATQHVMKSFVNRTNSADCIDITSTDFKKKLSVARFLFSGKFYHCFRLSGRWAPEAYRAAEEGLSYKQDELPQQCISCASEVVRKMGGNDQEKVLVAGLAGGMGLSGNACGALGAAIWMKALISIRESNKRISYSGSESEEMIASFYRVTDYEMECSKITGKRFETLDAHTEFIKNGGCEKLIDALSKI